MDEVISAEICVQMSTFEIKRPVAGLKKSYYLFQFIGVYFLNITELLLYFSVSFSCFLFSSYHLSLSPATFPSLEECSMSALGQCSVTFSHFEWIQDILSYFLTYLNLSLTL